MEFEKGHWNTSLRHPRIWQLTKFAEPRGTFHLILVNVIPTGGKSTPSVADRYTVLPDIFGCGSVEAHAPTAQVKKAPFKSSKDASPISRLRIIVASSKAPDAATSPRDDNDPDLQKVIPVCAVGGNGGAVPLLDDECDHEVAQKLKGDNVP
jgi:hypothetical protein